jgi:hypothetical protein
VGVAVAAVTADVVGGKGDGDGGFSRRPGLGVSCGVFGSVIGKMDGVGVGSAGEGTEGEAEGRVGSRGADGRLWSSPARSEVFTFAFSKSVAATSTDSDGAGARTLASDQVCGALEIVSPADEAKKSPGSELRRLDGSNNTSVEVVILHEESSRRVNPHDDDEEGSGGMYTSDKVRSGVSVSLLGWTTLTGKTTSSHKGDGRNESSSSSGREKDGRRN